MDVDEPAEAPFGIDPAASQKVFFAMLALVVGGLVAYTAARRGGSPPPKEIAADPLLVRGREVFLGRCASCHGEAGRGDGPLAKGLAGPEVGNLAGGTWRYGPAPEAVLGVIARGTIRADNRDSAMSGWLATLGPEDVRAAAAYTYHLAGRPIPAAYREPGPANRP